MMLKIRLQRVGRKHEPVFRIVVTDSKTAAKKHRRFHEVIGSFDPRRKEGVVIDTERAKHWLSKGAQASGTVHNILVDQKAIDAKKVAPVVPKKEAPVVEAPAEEKAEAAPAAEEVAAEETAPAAEAPAEAAEEEKSA
jgi:small subunit ribosomal protein S16